MEASSHPGYYCTGMTSWHVMTWNDVSSVVWRHIVKHTASLIVWIPVDIIAGYTERAVMVACSRSPRTSSSCERWDRCTTCDVSAAPCADTSCRKETSSSSRMACCTVDWTSRRSTRWWRWVPSQIGVRIFTHTHGCQSVSLEMCYSLHTASRPWIVLVLGHSVMRSHKYYSKPSICGR